MEDTSHIAQLLRDYLQETLSPDDEAVLKAWASASPRNRALLERISDRQQLEDGLKSWGELWGAASHERSTRITTDIRQRIAESASSAAKGRRMIRWVSYAAAVIAAVTVGFLFLGHLRESKQTQEVTTLNLAPGGNRATLQLADGRIIDLSEAQTGIVVADEIRYLDGSAVATSGTGHAGHEPDASRQYAQLTTPKGGTYQITLPDGSKVWLNAASTLKYPLEFADDARIVELVGEGYFEVKKDSTRPFQVHSNGQEVVVLGTAFNISAYPEISEIKTTLVTGTVEIRSSDTHRPTVIVLKPGQQSIIEGGELSVEEVYVPAVIAWKDGLFDFTGKNLKQVLAELGRWYDFEVLYETTIGDDKFYGELYRNSRLSTVLEALRHTRVKFRIEETRNINGTLDKTMIVY